VGNVDIEGLSTALQRLLTSGAVTPDDDLEDQIRTTFGLPPRDADGPTDMPEEPADEPADDEQETLDEQPPV
jgi:hypothetical protein